MVKLTYNVAYSYSSSSLCDCITILKAVHKNKHAFLSFLTNKTLFKIESCSKLQIVGNYAS